MYLSVDGVCRTQKIIEKSRFITTSVHVASEKEAQDFILGIRKEFADATHNCYAFVGDSYGNYLRFSDDGEPSGTAGMPILDVIRNRQLYETAVVVTRYFGGIKLGAGGLVRAYSGCTAENLDIAKKVRYEMCSEIEITVGYSFADSVTRYCTAGNAVIIKTLYGDEVSLTVSVKKTDEQLFTSGLINRLNGKLKINRLKEYYFPFEA